MAQTFEIQDQYLNPGDLVDVEYLITPGAPEGMVTLAIREAKKILANDPRFHYQGSREELRTNKSGLTGSITEDRYIILTVQVADPRKVTGSYTPEPEVQTAGVPGVVLLSSLAAIVVGAAIAYSAHCSVERVQITYQTAVVQKETTQVVMESDLSNDQKTTVLTGQAEAMKAAAAKKSMGSGIAAAGGSLATAGIIIAVLLVVFGGPRRSRGIEG
jgi:hypothetical protein